MPLSKLICSVSLPTTLPPFLRSAMHFFLSVKPLTKMNSSLAPNTTTSVTIAPMTPAMAFDILLSWVDVNDGIVVAAVQMPVVLLHAAH